MNGIASRDSSHTSVAQTVDYDNLGRVTEIENPLGTFVYNYLNHTGRVSSIELPNGQVTDFACFNNAGDQRLEEIKHLDAQSTPAVISKFNYEYSAKGNILTWRQEHSGAPSVPKIYDFRYDAVDQLTGATLKNASTSAILKESVYRYDKAGNRSSEQTDLAVTSSTNNNLNQVTSMSGGGPLEFTGTVNEPSTVTVGGNPAAVDASGNFRGTATVSSGTSTVAVVATDASSNVTTKNYDVTVPSGSARTLVYDLNGNMTDDGNGKVYAWDAANRLSKITYGAGGSTEFTYDGLGRRVKIVEKDGSSSVTSDKRFVWVGLEIAEERNSSNSVVKRFYGQGVQIPGASSPANKLFYTRDHLGSVRELTDNDAVVRGRWDFDSYGKRSANLITSSALETDFAYTGHYFHERSNLTVAPYRFYDADLGKWLSRDPIEEEGGINLYGYVSNNPINYIDPTGERPQDIPRYIAQIVTLPFKLIKFLLRKEPKVAPKVTPKEAPNVTPKMEPHEVPNIPGRFKLPERDIMLNQASKESLISLSPLEQLKLRQDGFTPFCELPQGAPWIEVNIPGVPTGWVKKLGGDYY